MFTFHVTRIGFGQFMEALLSVEQVNALLPVDVYIGVILPDGRFVSWVGDSAMPTLVIRATPVAFLSNVVPRETTAFRVPYILGASDPLGWYMLYGLVVSTDADPVEPSNWIRSSFFPLLVRPALNQ
jgi:hypothetical protein